MVQSTRQTRIQPDDGRKTDTDVTPLPTPTHLLPPTLTHATHTQLPCPLSPNRTLGYSSRHTTASVLLQPADLAPSTTTHELPTHTTGVRVPYRRGCHHSCRICQPKPNQEERNGCTRRSTGLHWAHRLTDFNLGSCNSTLTTQQTPPPDTPGHTPARSSATPACHLHQLPT